MATATYQPPRTKNVTIYLNGDSHFLGKKLVINQTFRSWEAVLDACTRITRSNAAIRNISTPEHGTLLGGLEDLTEDGKYVALTTGKLKHFQGGYLGIGDRLMRAKITPRADPHKLRRIQVSGRIRKVDVNVCRIFIHENGNDLVPGKCVVLDHRTLKDWALILNKIQDKIQLRRGHVGRLYSVDGDNVNEPAQLQSNASYVVAATNERFLKRDYGYTRRNFSVGRRKLNEENSPRLRKRYTVIPPIRSRKTTTTDSSGKNSNLDQSANSTKSHGTPRRAGPSKKQGKKAAEKKDENGIFYAPVKHKRTPPENAREVNYDEDGGGVFKAKEGQNESANAEEVEETNDTKVDLPIDQVEAEEVADDEEVEEVPEKNNDKNNNKDGRSTAQSQKSAKSIKSAKSERQRSPTPPNQETPREEAQNDDDQTEEVTDRRTPSDKVEAKGDSKQAKAATKIQSHYRSYFSRKGLEKNKQAATKIQANYKGYQTRKSQKQKQESATIIQANYRGFKARKVVPAQKTQKNSAATKIQSNYRGYKTRRDLQKGQNASNETVINDNNPDVDDQPSNEVFNDNEDAKEASDIEDKPEDEVRAPSEAEERDEKETKESDNEEDSRDDDEPAGVKDDQQDNAVKEGQAVSQDDSDQKPINEAEAALEETLKQEDEVTVEDETNAGEVMDEAETALKTLDDETAKDDAVKTELEHEAQIESNEQVTEADDPNAVEKVEVSSQPLADAADNNDEKVETQQDESEKDEAGDKEEISEETSNKAEESQVDIANQETTQPEDKPEEIEPQTEQNIEVDQETQNELKIETQETETQQLEEPANQQASNEEEPTEEEPSA